MHTLLAFAFAFTQADYAKLAGALAFAAGLYLAYKILWHHDFGVPVRRRLFTRGLKVERDQVAFVPIWWSDLQVQRAIKSHWKATLRGSFTPQTPARERG